MSAAKFDLDTDFVRKLAKLLEETGLSEIEYAEGHKKIRCAVSHGPSTTYIPAPPAVATPIPRSDAKPTQIGTPVASPMVGTVYLAATPGGPPFVQAGGKVKVGDTLVIIEAMKVMNPIKAQKEGTIAEVLVSDAQPVEFGETLMILT